MQFHAASLRLAPLGAGAVHPINGKLRDELLSVEIFNSLREAQILIESWRRHYNAVRPHSALGYRPPAPRSLCPLSPRGRLHNPGQFRRPRSDWSHDRR